MRIHPARPPAHPASLPRLIRIRGAPFYLYKNRFNHEVPTITVIPIGSQGLAIPDLETSVFVIPSAQVKNKTDRVVVLNNVAKSVIDSVRGEYAEFVLTRNGKPLTGMNSSGWKLRDGARQRDTKRL